ncbi:MAG: chemotaxis protein CheD [Gemmatimonadota bacterium]|nr:MAG: chemotaxis protein CheD [Gemmatimonadota bacterium]
MRVYVPMGERRVGKREGTLSITGLGSCVAVVLYDDQCRVGGLVHVLLPDPTFSKRDRCWLFATTAIPALVRELEEAGADRARLTARLVGGATMFQDLLPQDKPNIGQRNIVAARSTLAKNGIPIVAEEVGGEFGRSVDFDLSDGRIRVSSQGKNRVEI